MTALLTAASFLIWRTNFFCKTRRCWNVPFLCVASCFSYLRWHLFCDREKHSRKRSCFVTLDVSPNFVDANMARAVWELVKTPGCCYRQPETSRHPIKNVQLWSPQTLEMSRGLVKNTWVHRHVHGWWYHKVIWKLSSGVMFANVETQSRTLVIGLAVAYKPSLLPDVKVWTWWLTMLTCKNVNCQHNILASVFWDQKKRYTPTTYVHTHIQTHTTPVCLMCNRKPGVPMLLCMGLWKSSRVMKQKL